MLMKGRLGTRIDWARTCAWVLNIKFWIYKNNLSIFQICELWLMKSQTCIQRIWKITSIKKSDPDVLDGFATVCMKRKAKNFVKFIGNAPQVQLTITLCLPHFHALRTEHTVKMCPWWLSVLISPINRLLDMTVIRHLSWKNIIMS